MEASVELAKEEAKTAKSQQSEAEEAKAEALSKLQVLTGYFNEKQAELTK